MFMKDFILRVVKSCQFPTSAVSLPSINFLLPILTVLVQSLIISCPHYCVYFLTTSSAPILSLPPSEIILHNAGLIFLKYSSDRVIPWLRYIL